MNKHVLLSFLIMGTAFLAFSCTEKNEKLESPSIILSQDAVTVPFEGGTFSIGYSIVNPADETTLPKVTPENTEWVSDFTVDASEIKFNVAPAFAGAGTSVKVEVSYPGAAERAYFTITRENGEAPALTLTVKNISTESFMADVTAYDKEMSWFVSATPVAELEGLNINTSEALFEYNMQDIQRAIKFGNAHISNFVQHGDMTNLEFTAEYDTEMAVYVYGIDTTAMAICTDVYYQTITTEDVERIDAAFSIEADTDCDTIVLNVTPEGYDGWYCVDAYDMEELEGNEDLFRLCYYDFKGLASMFRLYDGYSDQQILEATCHKGTKEIKLHDMIKPEKEYTVVVYAVNEEALAYSIPVTANVTTGSAHESDNTITIKVTDISARSAHAEFTTTNEDTYVTLTEQSKIFEGMTDDEILSYIKENYYLRAMTASGDKEEDLTSLLPDTDYTVMAIGCSENSFTTEIFKYDFRTTAEEVGEVDFKLVVDGYYDLAEVAGLSGDSKWQQYLDMEYEVILSVHAETDAEKYYYWFGDPEELSGYSDAELQQQCIYYELCAPSATRVVNYNQSLMIFGFAIDQNGNYGALYKETITFTEDGVSDAEDFVGK